MDQAARDFARKYNKISIKNNCEYATIIVRIKNKRPPYKNYFYSYKYITPWTNGKKTEVDTKRNIWEKYDTVAFIHTHGRYHKGTNYSNKYFSDTDINISNNTGMPMYVVLPSGICYYHNPNNQNENRSFKWSGVYHDKKALSKHGKCKLCVKY